jgi:hypothetical protein
MYIEAFLGIRFDHTRDKVKYIVAVRMLTRNLILPCENFKLVFVLKTVSKEEQPYIQHPSAQISTLQASDMNKKFRILEKYARK